MDAPLTPFVVFADDWGRHPSSCQHLFRHLLPRHPTVWVNTIGTRPPRFDLATLRRGWEKLRHWSRRKGDAEDRPHNLTVANPRMWPWFRSRFDRWLNRELLLRQLDKVLRSLPAPPVAVTTLPIVADLVGRLPVARWVYYCVDDFGEWPGLDHEPLRRMEGELVPRVDRVIAVSDTLVSKMAALGSEARLLTHGVDLDFWRGDAEPLPEVASLERPLVVFWGVVDRRMDAAWVKRLAAELTAGTVVLVGPEQEPDPALLGTPRVRRIQPLLFDRLPGLACEASVLVMPYVDSPVTRAMQPLKLKEYLATGKPAVVRDLPANRAWADCMDVAGTAEEFVRLVKLRVETGLPPEQRAARARLANESWAAKALLFEQWALRGGP